ncbi:hypothetical protein BDD12DRAFT_860263 [Trichophaea hybrida]|nr:hypothetical protein BDD12DRAFT_860263 [Trichophaea hybrida]
MASSSKTSSSCNLIATCAICLDEVVDAPVNKTTVYPYCCFAPFHKLCAGNWILESTGDRRGSGRCPYCRQGGFKLGKMMEQKGG